LRLSGKSEDQDSLGAGESEMPSDLQQVLQFRVHRLLVFPHVVPKNPLVEITK
jgi:hypothetical protein